MSRLLVKRLSKVQKCCGITTLQIWPYLGTSKCWGHSVLQTLALVVQCYGPYSYDMAQMIQPLVALSLAHVK